MIAGVSSHWGSELARALERDPGVSYLAGVDTSPPKTDLDRTEFIEADIRNPVISRILPGLEPDVVVHCGILWYPEPGKPARALHDINVIGTLQLLAACEKCDGLEAVVARGSAAIYGSEGAAPSFYTEEMARRYPLKTRFQRDIGELESYFDNFARRHPQVTCTMLRFQPEIGPGLDQPLVRYLSAARGADPARFRPAAAARSRRGRDRRARRGDAQPGPRRGQRRPRRDDLPDPDPAARRTADGADPAPWSPARSSAGSGASSAPPTSTTTASACSASAAAVTTGG